MWKYSWNVIFDAHFSYLAIYQGASLANAKQKKVSVKKKTKGAVQQLCSEKDPEIRRY